MVTPTRIRMTPEEFKQLPETTQPTELIDGKMIVSPAPVHAHQKIVGRTFVFIDHLITGGQVKGEAVIAPMDLWLGADCVQPDVFWVGADNTNCKLGDDGYWYGAPDLVIEVLSPSTTHLDRGVKFDLYEQHHVREYWLVDPQGKYAEVFRHNAEKFARIGAFGIGQQFTSAVLSGIAVPVDALFGV